MRDHDDAARVGLQVLAEPDDRVRVEVVRRLVEDHRVRVREQDAGELDAAALTTGERLERLVEDAVRQLEVRRDRRRLGLGRVPAEGVELVVEPAVATHGLVGDVRVLARHVERRLADALHELAEAAGVEDALPGGVLGVAGTGVLRQVADLAGAVDLAAGGLRLPREGLGHRGLARAVPADETDLVALLDAEGHVLHEEAGPDADLEFVHGKHRGRPISWWMCTTVCAGGAPLR